MTELRFFTDPSCPWAWITSRWITEVAPARNLTVRWRTFSIEERDGAEPSPHIPA